MSARESFARNILRSRGASVGSPKVQPFSRAEEVEIFQHYARETNPKEKDRIRNQIVARNYGLVGATAREMKGFLAGSGFDQEDSFQQGLLGLIRAIELFDLEWETRFSTFAVYGIAQSIKTFLRDRGSMVRIPDRMTGKLRRKRRVVEKLTNELCRKPTPQEIAQELGLDNDVPPSISVSPLDDSHFGSRSFSGSVLIQARETLEEAQRDLRKMISFLERDWFSPQERFIFRLRHGLNGVKALRHKEVAREVAREFGDKKELTRERIRQICQKVWRELARLGSPVKNKEELHKLRLTISQITEMLGGRDHVSLDCYGEMGVLGHDSGSQDYFSEPRILPILECVAKRRSVSIDDLYDLRRRSRKIASARYLSFHLLTTILHLSPRKVSSHFGYHCLGSTVSGGLRIFERLLRFNPELGQEVEEIRQEVQKTSSTP